MRRLPNRLEVGCTLPHRFIILRYGIYELGSFEVRPK